MNPFRRFPRDLVTPVIVALVVVGFLAWVAVSVVTLGDELDGAREDRDNLQEKLDRRDSDVDDLQKAVRALVDQLEARGIEPVIKNPDDATEPVEPVDPEDTTAEISKSDLALVLQACIDSGECTYPLSTREAFDLVMRACDATGQCEGDRGRRGRPGKDAPSLSFDQVLAAVSALCDGSCEGRDGRTPSAEELQDLAARYFAAYCAERNGCIGNDGTDGTDGQNGRSFGGMTCNADGTWTYTTSNPDGTQSTQTIPGPCRARDGRDGTDGTDGDDGASVQRQVCQDDGTWLIYYTDGRTTTSPGPCRVEETTPPPVDPGTS